MAGLTHLNLGGNQFGDDGVSALAKAITPVSEGGSGALPSIKKLDLGANKFGDEGVKAFAAAAGGVNLT